MFQRSPWIVTFQRSQQRNRNRLLAVLSIICLICLVWTPTARSQNDKAVVTLFGDSVSVGYLTSRNPGTDFGNGRLSFGLPSTLLSNLLNSSGRPSVVANFGIGGSPSGPSGNPGLVGGGNGVSRINSNLDYIKRRYAGSAYYLLIMYGTNDRAYGISPSTTGFNIGILIDRALSKGVTPVVSTIPPCSCRSQSEQNSVNNHIRSRTNTRISQGKRVYLVDNYAALLPQWASLNGDGIHPNAAGYRIIAQNWFGQALSNLIRPNRVSIAPIINFLLDDDTP